MALVLLALFGGQLVPGPHASASRQDEGEPAAGATTAPAPSKIKMRPKTALTKAQEALDAKHLTEALRLYEIALENSSKGSPHHVQALFGAGMLRLHPDLRLPNSANGGESLADLDSRLYEEGGIRVGAFVALELANEASTAKEEIKQLREQLLKAEQSARDDKEQLAKQVKEAQDNEQKCREEAKNQGSTVKRLEDEKTEHLVEIEKLRTELEAKDAAITARDLSLSRMKKALTKVKPPLKSEPTK